MTFLRSHPFAMQAMFEHVLVLTYALPEAHLRPLLPPGLVLDTFEDFGFLAIAMVQTRGMRLRHLPRLLGRDFFLTGYRIFTRFQTRRGRVLRGLRILRSDTDSEFMVKWGNRLTHYGYRKASVDYRLGEALLEIDVCSENHEADLKVRAHLSAEAAPLPEGSPFPDLRTARKFAGPLPFTFEYDRERRAMIRVEGVRSEWNPMQTRVEVLRNTFLEQTMFLGTKPVLASAFHLAHVPYRWKRGVRESVTA